MAEQKRKTYTESMPLADQHTHHANLAEFFDRQANGHNPVELKDFYAKLAEDHRKMLAEIEAKMNAGK